MACMQACLDVMAFEWIRSGRDTLRGHDESGWRGLCFPPATEDVPHLCEGVPPNRRVLREYRSPFVAEGKWILRVPACGELRSLIVKLRANLRGARLRWKEIAEALKVPFEPELNLEWFRAKLETGCWPRVLRGPDEGSLDAEECSALASVLRPFTGNQGCYFRFAEMPFVGTNKQLLFHGALEEVSLFLGEKTYQFTPEYWWPADRSWCVCSDYDLMFTVVGGSQHLISRILKDSFLETTEVTPSTRIDFYAPMK